MVKTPEEFKKDRETLTEFSDEVKTDEDQQALLELAEESTAERADSEELRKHVEAVIEKAEQQVNEAEQSRLEDNTWQAPKQ